MNGPAVPESVRLDLDGGFGCLMTPDEARRIANLLNGAAIAPRLAQLLQGDAERAERYLEQTAWPLT